MSCATEGCRRQAEVAVTGGVVALIVCAACAVDALRVGGARVVVLRRVVPPPRARPRGA